MTKPGLLTLTIKDKSALYAAYMPFLDGGGLFIPTNDKYNFGDEVFLLLSLIDEPEKLLDSSNKTFSIFLIIRNFIHLKKSSQYP